MSSRTTKPNFIPLGDEKGLLVPHTATPPSPPESYIFPSCYTINKKTKIRIKIIILECGMLSPLYLHAGTDIYNKYLSNATIYNQRPHFLTQKKKSFIPFIQSNLPVANPAACAEVPSCTFLTNIVSMGSSLLA